MAAVQVDEVRVLDGPNLYFTRPAVKVSLALKGYLAQSRPDAVDLARRLGLATPRPGKPNTAQRQRFVMRLAAHVTRRIAADVGVQRLTVRTRTGASVDDIVVAIPWRHRTWARVTGEAIGPVLEELLPLPADLGAVAADAVIERAAEGIRDTDPGPGSSVIVPTVPVVSITGTNGKTTTTRLVAHVCMVSGLKTAWSSTAGIVVMGETVEEGDFSGPAGARAVLETPGVEVGVLETARGGMLLRGMGVAVNDVSVVTNVTADHLGMNGIDTLDQLAEVKAIVTTVTKPDGWVVLNGEDPRVWPMRHRIKAKPWAFSVDPDAPALRESLAVAGRGITVLDGEIVVLTPGTDPDRLVKIVDVPLTLSGLSRHNVANALAGAAAALGLGMPRQDVVEGLRTFLPDPVLNDGRLNAYTLPLPARNATVILDLAHNEAGVEALLEVARGLVAPGARVHLGLGGTGDRADEAIEALGEIAGKLADRIVIAHKPKYLRGRSLDEIDTLLRAGLARVGVAEVESFETEVEGLLAMVSTLSDGDVVALMCHDQRPAIQAWLAEQGATVDDARTIRRKVVRARGEHEYDAEIARLWALDDDQERLQAAKELLALSPSDPRLLYEWAGAHDAAGEKAEAVRLYRSAVEAGLREPHRHRAQIQAASSYRTLGRPSEALDLLAEVDVTHPGNASVAAFRALALADSGEPTAALALLIEALVDHATDDDATAYRSALRRQAAALRGETD